MKIRTLHTMRSFIICILTFVLAFSNTIVYAEPTTGDSDSTYADVIAAGSLSADGIANGSSAVSIREMDSLTSDIEKTAQLIDDTNAELTQLQTDIDALQAQQSKQYEDMKARIKYMYENTDNSLLAVFLQSKSMTEFLNAAEFIENISSYDRDMLTEMQKTNDSLVQKQNELSTQQSALAEQKEEMEAKHQELEDSIATANAAAASAGSGGSYIVSGGGVGAESSDIDLLAAIIQCEAGTDNYDALLAVGACVINRVKSPEYPNNIHDVVYQSGQFSPVWEGKLDRVLSTGASQLCYIAAQDAINGSSNIGGLVSFRMWPGSSHTGLVIGDNVFF